MAVCGSKRQASCGWKFSKITPLALHSPIQLISIVPFLFLDIRPPNTLCSYSLWSVYTRLELMILEFLSLIITAPNGEEQDNALKALWADGNLWFQETGGLWLEFQ